jgi:hypothetical protein
MTEFTKTKMHFTLLLLGALFALHPVVMRIEDYGFWFPFGARPEDKVFLKIQYVYALLAGLVALVVYFYSMILLSVRWAGLAERIGNTVYALTLLVLPLYGGLYLAHLLAERMEVTEIAWMVRAAPWVAVGLAVFWLVLAQIGVIWLRRKLSAQDVEHRLTQLVEREAEALSRAQEMFAGDHFDLVVIESWKALEARLQRALLAHDYHQIPASAEALLTTAQRAGILDNLGRERVNQVLHAWHVAIGTEPTLRETADKALKTTRDLLSTIPVMDVRRLKRPAGATL